MNKDIVNNISDKDFIEIVQKSETINDVARYLGFKHSPGAKSREKIKFRINKLGLELKKLPKEELSNKESLYNNSKEIGLIGEKYFEFLCAKFKIPCYKDNSENQPYDYIIELGEGFKKVQVKTTEFTNNGSVIFYTRHGNFYYKGEQKECYNSKDIDFLFLFCIELQEGYFVKVNKDNNKIPTSITVRINESKNNQELKCHFREDLLFENVISSL